MLTLIAAYFQHKNTSHAKAIDYIPIGKWIGFIVSGDAMLITLFLWHKDIISGEAVWTCFFTALALLVTFTLSHYLIASELETSRKDIAEARKIVRLKKMEEGTEIPKERKIKMELEGLRASHKRSIRSVQTLIHENRHLRAQYRNANERYKKLQTEIGENNFETISDDAAKDNILRENEILNELNEVIRKQSEDIKRMRKQMKKGIKAKRPDWMSFLPYAHGDTIEEVKLAYRSLAKALHPDISEADGEKMKQLNKAWAEAQEWFGKK